MRVTWSHLSTWEGCCEVASSLHDFDGFPSSSPLPVPQVDRCLSPTPVCIESGWCIAVTSGRACTAPPTYLPAEYMEVAKFTCPARKPNAITGLEAQESECLSQDVDLPDAETIDVLRWVKNMLITVAIGKHGGAVAEYAHRLVGDRVEPVTMEVVQALGEELHRRYEQRCGYKSSVG